MRNYGRFLYTALVHQDAQDIIQHLLSIGGWSLNHHSQGIDVTTKEVKVHFEDQIVQNLRIWFGEPDEHGLIKNQPMGHTIDLSLFGILTRQTTDILYVSMISISPIFPLDLHSHWNDLSNWIKTNYQKRKTKPEQKPMITHPSFYVGKYAAEWEKQANHYILGEWEAAPIPNLSCWLSSEK